MLKKSLYFISMENIIDITKEFFACKIFFPNVIFYYFYLKKYFLNKNNFNIT